MSGLKLTFDQINPMWTNYLLIQAFLYYISLNLSSHDIKNNPKLHNHIKALLEKMVSLPLRFLNMADLRLMTDSYRDEILPKFASWND